MLIPVEKMMSIYPSVSVTQRQMVRFINGGGLLLERIKYSRKQWSSEGLFQ